MTLYVDGCSFIRASGLPVEYRISTQIGADADFSVEGKSNMQIVKDLRDNISRYDTFILSFTFSNRFVVFYKGMDECPLNMLPTVIGENFFPTDKEYQNYLTFYKFYYQNLNEEFMSRLSDFYVDGAIALLKAFNKKYIIYTSEERDSLFHNEINLIHFRKEFLREDKHLNEAGMINWGNDIKKRLQNGQ